MREPAGDEAIYLRSDGRRHAGSAGLNYWMIRVVYMRVLGFAWLVKALYAGALIIGLFGHPFHAMSAADQASTAFAAIGDSIAGVGLWLTVGWGAVIWIVVSLAEIGFAVGGAKPLAPALSVLVPILAYLALVVLSRRQVDRQT